jgi:hypothetical protein
MLLGQLLYFEKELGKLTINTTLQNLLDIEVASLDREFLISLQSEVDQSFILNQLKNHFIVNYKELLIQNELNKAVVVWNAITDHKITLEKGSYNPTLFQTQIHDWIQGGSSIHDLHTDILQSGKLSTDEQDFALYYGIHFLDTLLRVQQHDPETTDSPIVESSRPSFDDDFSEDIELLVVGPNEFLPLFTNINIGFIDSTTLNLGEKIDKFRLGNPAVKLILIDESLDTSTVQFKKETDSDLLISTIDFNSQPSVGFFDNLVKKTLGIKLN